MFVGSLLLMPLIVILLPADYFLHPARRPALWARYHPVLRGLILVLKNLLGVVLLLGGVTMLILPGQGVLTILAGLILMDFPGKYQCEVWLICRAPLDRALNWLRLKSGRDGLCFPREQSGS